MSPRERTTNCIWTLLRSNKPKLKTHKLMVIGTNSASQNHKYQSTRNTPINNNYIILLDHWPDHSRKIARNLSITSKFQQCGRIAGGERGGNVIASPNRKMQIKGNPICILGDTEACRGAGQIIQSAGLITQWRRGKGRGIYRYMKIGNRGVIKFMRVFLEEVR